MKIFIKSPHRRPSRKLVDYTLKRVDALSMFDNRIEEVRVHLKERANGGTENKVCDILLKIPGSGLSASKTAPTFEEAVGKTVETIRRDIW